MSEVIRRAILELELRQIKGGGLESPSMRRSYEEQTKAAKEVEKQHVANTRAAHESGRAHEDFGRRAFASFAHAGHGITQLTRGIALLGASGEEDTRKLLENLIKIEAAVSIAKGAGNLAKFAAHFGPLGVAVAAVSAVAAAGVGVWEHYAAAERRAAREMEEHRKQAKELSDQLQKGWDQQHAREATDRSERAGAAGFGADISLSRSGRAAAMSAEMAELQKQRQELEKTHRQRGRGFQAGTFRGNEKEAFDALLEFGSKSQLSNEMDYQQQRRALARRQGGVGKEQGEAKMESIRDLERQQIESSRRLEEAMTPLEKWGREKEKWMFDFQKTQQQPFMDVFAPPGMASLMKAGTMQDFREGGIHAEANRQLQEVIEAQKKFADESIKAYQEATDKIIMLRRELEGAAGE